MLGTVQETAGNSPAPEMALGLGTMVQVRPFQRSVSVWFVFG